MITESGKIAGGELGDDPLSVIKDAIATMQPVLDATPGDTLIAYTNGGIVFNHYLETRILELTVHTLGLQTALGLSDEPPREALLATCRGVMPDRFSVLG